MANRVKMKIEVRSMYLENSFDMLTGNETETNCELFLTFNRLSGRKTLIGMKLEKDVSACTFS